MKEIWVIESSELKLALLMGMRLCLLIGERFGEVATHNDNRCKSITIEVSQKRSRKLFKLPLVT